VLAAPPDWRLVVAPFRPSKCGASVRGTILVWMPWLDPLMANSERIASGKPYCTNSPARNMYSVGIWAR
jgi:hypothetical protein